MFVPVGTEEYVPRRRFPVVTVALVSLNSLVFLAELLLSFMGGTEAVNRFIMLFGATPAVVVGGQQLFTLLTSTFVHSSLTHAGFNMLYLLAFGDNVEDRLGRGRFLLFYLLAGVLASLTHIASNPASTLPSVGASGAIAGVLGAYLLLFPRAKVRLFFFLGPFSRVTRVSALLYIGFWFALQFFSGVGSLGAQTAETGGVAYFAHLGGFVAGILLVLLHKRRTPKSAMAAERQQPLPEVR